MTSRLVRATVRHGSLSCFAVQDSPARLAMRIQRNFPTLSLVRTFRVSPRPSKSSTPTPIPSTKPSQAHENPTLPSFNLFHAVRGSRPAVRYTVYAGLGLMASVESTFWISLIKAKFFPSNSEEEKQKAEEFLARIREAVADYKATWMPNYWRYYGGYVWGVGER